MIKKQSLIVLVFSCASFLGFGQTPWINEIHYDNNGVDVNEGVEIAVPTGYSCANNLQVIPYNGNNGQSYTPIVNVPSSGGTTSNGVTFYWVAISGLQNGAPDGLALVCTNTNTVIQFLSYEGSFMATDGPANGIASNNISVSESSSAPVGTSIQLQGSGCQYSDFTWVTSVVSTYDLINTGHTIDCSPSITLTPTSLTGFAYPEGSGPSGEQNFTVAGANLTDDIDVTSPTNWEITTISGGPYQTTPISFTPISGTVATQTIYTRMVSGLLNVNSPFSGNITAACILDAITENIGVNGTVSLPLAEVVITEIMYNTDGFDDEWIEICNVSGSTQDISNYIIDVGGSTLFTFLGSTTILNGDCIIVSLGSNGDGTFNNDCEITPVIYGIGANTNDTDNLPNNTTEVITLYSSNGVTKADEVTYDDGDGADGNGSSLHVIDAVQDNSDAGTNWQEVDLGGSSGTNSLVPNCVPMVAEIRVDGNIGAFPNIPDDDTFVYTPIGTNNTLFAAQFVGSTQSKSFRIQNLGGLDLTNSVTLIGADPGEFNISVIPASPVIYGTPSILEITFAPTTAGVKNAIVRIANNDDNTDGDTEEIYTFNIQGEGKCVGVIDAISPTYGPVNTIVTVSATGLDLSTATASFNGVPVITLNYIVATDELEVNIPDTATLGNLEIIDGNGCTGFFAFDVTDNTIVDCEGGANLTDLFISEVTDATTGGLSYIEIYNGTGGDVSLSGYSLEIISNGNSSGNSVTLDTSFTLVDQSTYVVAIGLASSPPVTTDPGANTCPINGSTGGNGQLADQTSSVGGINKRDNEHDMIQLVFGSTVIDEFGVYQDDDWMDSTIITGNRGFNFRRLANASPLPNPNFSLTGLTDNWNVIDWVGSGLSSCNTNNYSNIGEYDFSSGTPPTIDPTGPTITSSCNSATISVSATEGYADSIDLTYQWFYSAPEDLDWEEVDDPTDTIHVGENTAMLQIEDTSGLEGYQYYCEVREDGASCSTSSNAEQLTLPSTTWESPGSWSAGPPDSGTIAIIDHNYNTATANNGDIAACSLIVNSGATLDIADDADDISYVLVQNDVTIYGKIIVRTSGSLVQVDDDGTFTLDPNGSAIVEKYTANLNHWYEYTYWSSPVISQTIEGAFPDTPVERRFRYDAQNYKDSLKEKNGNSNEYDPGQDDVDDTAPWDWQIASGAMEVGKGYAATSSLLGMFPNASDQALFNGAFNTGDKTVSVYRNDDELFDNNWNLLGNPYPSAIDADLFLSVNSEIDDTVEELSHNGVVDGAIFFWSQWTNKSRNTQGNQHENFSQDDYAIINTFIQTAGGDGLVPTRHIPSGQGFFISYANGSPGTEISPTPNKIIEGTVTFTNDMRVTGNNNQFFRGAISKSDSESNILKINLTTDNGLFNQMAIGYVDKATNGNDGMGYDTTRNLSIGLHATIYTSIEGEDKKFAIQGKDPSSLDLDEIIALGFDSSIDVATLYTLSIAKLEGEFLTSNNIYLRDYEMNIVHNLSESDYTFTSEVGEFKERFEIVFTDASLSINSNDSEGNYISIIELDSDNVKFKTSSNLDITSVKIFDIQGRLLYDLKGNSHTEIYNLSSLSQATYLAKIELSNGVIITKKAIKRK